MKKLLDKCRLPVSIALSAMLIICFAVLTVIMFSGRQNTENIVNTSELVFEQGDRKTVSGLLRDVLQLALPEDIADIPADKITVNKCKKYTEYVISTDFALIEARIFNYAYLLEDDQIAAPDDCTVLYYEGNEIYIYDFSQTSSRAVCYDGMTRLIITAQCEKSVLAEIFNNE